MKRKVIVIGAGISGLSAGIYALKCGFDVTILESHSIAGGNCTAWKRKGYLFEGGMHWLAGSNPNEQMNKMWRHTGALDDSVKIRYPEPFLEYNHKGVPVRFYRDVDVTERHLLKLAPNDTKEVKKLCNNIRKIKNLAMPVTDIRGVKITKKQRPPLSMLFSAISGMGIIKKFTGVSRDEYVNRFSHEGLRELIRSVTYENMGVAPLFFTLGSLARGDGGFPEGGSLPFAGRIVKTFKSLGGELLLNTRADRVVVENGKATGVVANGNRFDADAVIVTSDTMAVDRLFDIPLKSKWMDEMRAATSPTMAVFVCLGINADLQNRPAYEMIKLGQPVRLAEQTYEYLGVSNYANDPNYSPAGKTAMTMQLPGDTYDFWKHAKEDGRYEDEKRKLGEEIAKALTARIPEMDGKVEVIDIATPLTYERYCANWKGSWMTNMTKDMKMKTYPAVIEGLSGVYFAGQRMMPPGGFPPALMSSRTAVQYLCRDIDTIFVSEE